MNRKSTNTMKIIGSMMLITVIGKLLGLVRSAMQGNYYGFSTEANAFTIASLIPQTFFEIVFATIISASFIPIFNECMEQRGEEDSFHFANDFVTLLGLITFIATLACMVFAHTIVPWFAPGFDQETLDLSVLLLRIMLPTIFLTGITYAQVSILQSYGKFMIPAALSIFFNLSIIAYYAFLNPRFGIYGLATTYLMGWLLQILIQVPTLHKLGYRYHFKLQWSGEMRKVTKLVLPAMLSTWIQPINYMICVKFASGLLGGGGVSALSYANNLYIIIVGVVVSSITNVIFPDLSRLNAKAEGNGFREIVKSTTKALCFILLPMMVGLFLLCVPFVQLIYGNNPVVARETAMALQAFSPGMLGFGLQMLLSRVYFAKQQGFFPFLSGVLSILLNYILCSYFVRNYGIVGVAFSASVASMISAVILLFGLKKIAPDVFRWDFLKQVIKMIVAVVFMGIVVIFMKYMLTNLLGDSFLEEVLLLLLVTLSGVISYFAGAYVLGVVEVRIFGKK